jgi:hypothetical protein
MGIMLLLPAAVAFASDTLIIGDTTESTTGGFKFPDGTVQTSAYSGGVTLTSPDGSITVGGTATAPTVKLNFTLLDGLYAPLSGSSHYVAKGGDTMTGTLAVTQAATSGTAGSFRITHSENTSDALSVSTGGTGNAGYFDITERNNFAAALYARTSGFGSAIKAESGPYGMAAGYFIGWGNNNSIFTIAEGSGNALRATTSGNGAAIYANGGSQSGYFENNGSGDAVYAVASSGRAVYGNNNYNGPAGYFQISNAGSSNYALYATTNGSGYAGYFSGKVNVTGAAHLASSSGNVGIGTTTPSQKLEVAGTIKATGTPGFQGDGSGLTNVSATDSTKVAKAGDTMTGTLTVNQGGTSGRAGSFTITSAASIRDALYASTSGTGRAVVGEVTGTGTAGYFKMTNAANSNNALFAFTTGIGNAGNFQISNSTSPAYALYATTTSTNSLGKAGYFAGNVHITGTLTKGGGYFVQPHGTEPSREVVYAFFEGPEHAVFLRGKAKLANGQAVIETPEYWRVVAGADEDITVQFTPRSADSTGLAAVEVTRERIVVRELLKGQGSYDFDYFITAKRAGFERHEPIQANSHFSADGITREEFEQRYANTGDMTIAAMRDLLIRNGILTADGKLDTAVAEKLGWRLKESVEAQGR